jgi:hypothetical protein
MLAVEVLVMRMVRGVLTRFLDLLPRLPSAEVNRHETKISLKVRRI